MPNDAKLGLVLGVGLVIAIGVIFFRRDPAGAPPLSSSAPAAVAPVNTPVKSVSGQFRPAQAKVMSQSGAEPALTAKTAHQGEADSSE